MFDNFAIMPGPTCFADASGNKENWILELDASQPGTAVFTALCKHSESVSSEIFESYTSGDEFGFTKTVVPVRLAKYGNEKPISRSQAKRVLARIDSFGVVIFDFQDAEAIGQVFADEILRVFQAKHPDIEVHFVNANDDVGMMISRAKNRDA